MASPFAVDPDLKLDAPKNDPISASDLKQFDGSDESKPVCIEALWVERHDLDAFGAQIYVAIKGTVFDVSRKR